MHRNARTNRAVIVESERFARMEWTAYLNPIENLWDALGRGCV